MGGGSGSKVEGMSYREVGDWVDRDLGLGSRIARLFEDGNVDGKKLARMDDRDLEGLGVSSRQDREAILDALAKMKRSSGGGGLTEEGTLELTLMRGSDLRLGRSTR